MNPVKSAGMALQWLFTGTGQLAVGATEATLFCKSSPSEPVPDLQYQVLNFSSDSLQARIAPLARLYLHFQRLPAEEPRRDHAARSRRPMPPRILANYLTDPDDMRIMLAGFRIARQIAATEPFRSLVTEQVRPRPEIESDDEIAGYVRSMGSTVYHPCGTCRMGEDDRRRGGQPLARCAASRGCAWPTPP